MSHEATPSERARIPWYLWLGAAAMTSAAVGEEWDASWHRSIGRDSFFTPAHVMIYLCGVLAAILGIALLVQCTARSSSPRTAALRAQSVNIFGLHAPLGVFVAGWGGLAMATAGPFDYWWHAAYGLDVQLVSPPHVVLVAGIRMVDLGILLLAIAALNRARAHVDESALTTKLRRLVLYLGGLIVAGQMFFMLTYTRDVLQHRASPYQAMALAVPVAFAAIAFTAEHRWSAAITAAIYMLLLIAEIQLLPLFPAHPRLGPVYNDIAHMVPAKFPPLLIAPAIALDLLWRRTRRWKLLPLALVSGIVFTVVLVAVQWPFVSLLMGRLSHSHFFGTIYASFDAPPWGADRMHLFEAPLHGVQLLRGLVMAGVYATASSAVGIAFGRWMKGVQR
jgi:hypothetical protein